MSRSFVRTIIDQRPLTDTVGVAVMVVPDDLLTTSTVLGRVFCDADGNGAQGGEEPGIGGVTDYLDNGSMGTSVASGLLHFSRVAAGSHLAKIDTGTLPPGAVSQGGGRAPFYLTPGLPGQIAFPIACKSSWQRTANIAINEAVYRPPGTPPRRARPIQVVGKLSPFELTLDEKSENIGYVNLNVTSGGESAKAKKKGPNLQGIVNGELAAPLLFKTTFKKTDVLTWQLTILDLTDKPENLQTAEAIYFFAGQGRPSVFLLWDGKDAKTQKQLLQEGRRYGATMTFVTVEGHQIRSPIRTFGINWRDPNEVQEIPAGVPWEEVSATVLDATEGALFTEEQEPEKRTQLFVKEALAGLKARYKVVVEVHGFDEDEIASANNTRIFADNIQEFIIGQGHERTQVEARGRGLEDTLVMHMGLNNRQLNHRVSLRVLKPPVPPLKPLPR